MGALVFLLVGWVVVRNQPFADPNLVVLFRTVLSVAVATLGATIPGFLNLDWKGKGLAVRAGGALALLVLTFVWSPNVVKSPAKEKESVSQPQESTPTPKKAFTDTLTLWGEQAITVVHGVIIRTGEIGFDGQQLFVDINADPGGGRPRWTGRTRQGSAIDVFKDGCENFRVLVRSIEIQFPANVGQLSPMEQEAHTKRSVSLTVDGRCE
jgi:hypothetical protein